MFKQIIVLAILVSLLSESAIAQFDILCDTNGRIPEPCKAYVSAAQSLCEQDAQCYADYFKEILASSTKRRSLNLLKRSDSITVESAIAEFNILCNSIAKREEPCK